MIWINPRRLYRLCKQYCKWYEKYERERKPVYLEEIVQECFDELRREFESIGVE